jgi:cysteine desulfurase/selenocysteine lyase
MEKYSDFSNLIVGVNKKVPLVTNEYVTAINFDNAATTPPLYSVMQEIEDFAPWYSSIHRGAGYKSILSSDIYEEGRDIIKSFVNADKKKDVLIYTKNTTEAINLLSYILAENDDQQVILSTDMEHLANDLPWRDKFEIDYVGIDESGMLSLEDLELKLVKYGGRVKTVTVTGASNVTGYKNPIYKIAKIVHKHKAKLLVDGAQLAPHYPIDMRPYDSPEHIDYLVFSAHKMYAPFGIGVLIGPKESFEGQEPFCKGGGAVKLVSHQFINWSNPPDKEEAGTPNVMGVVALLAAIKTLKSIGMNVIDQYEQKLIRYAIDRLTSIEGIKLYCCTKNNEDRLSIISFDLPGIHHELLATILSQEAGISVRSGLFCAHPYIEKLLGLTNQKLKDYQNNPDLPCPGLIRISLAFYNNCHEIDIMIDLLKKITKNKNAYKQKYKI